MTLDGNAVRSVDRAAALLLELGDCDGEAGVTELARRRGLHKLTDRTITGLEPLLEELAKVRRRGYATAFGEFESSLNAVAAPVYDARGHVAAAVDVWGPSFRVTPTRVPELVQQVRASAA